MKLRIITSILLLLFVITQINPNSFAQTKEKKDKVSKTEKAEKKTKPTSKSDDEAIGKTKDGKIVYAGPRGGFYYLSSGNNKIYINETEVLGIKVVGKTKDGKNIYEGPRGGRFYYSDSGEKVYMKK